jgi:hypothetical protein
MRSFAALEWIAAPTGRQGRVAVVEADQEMERDHPDIIGQTVLIDGRQFTVRGVDRHLPNRPIAVGEQIGLLVVDAAEKP